jgi:hypothetical protein
MTTPDQEPKPRRRWPTYLAVVLVLVCLIYPLSIGPALVLLQRYPQFEQAAPIVYGPVAITADKTGTGRILSAYVNWWSTTFNSDNATIYEF